MDLNFQYEKADVLQALRFHFMRRKEIKVFRVILIWLGLLALLAFSLRFIEGSELLALILMLIVLAVVFWYVLPLSIYAKTKTFQDSIRLVPTHEGLTIRTQFADRQLPWRGIQEVVETKDFFLLYRNTQSFFLVPGRAFKDSEQRQVFRDLLRTWVSDYRVQ